MEEKLGDFAVAPGEGAWIEISAGSVDSAGSEDVAPGEGAWIEMVRCR